MIQLKVITAVKVKMMVSVEVAAVAVHLRLAQLALQAVMVALELHQALLVHQ
jgi:hypothetical protein